MDLSFESFYSSIILGNESLPLDFFDQADSSILASFVNSLDMEDAAYLSIFKQLEDFYHMHTSKSIEVDISDDPAYPKIIHLEDILDAKERAIATTLLKKYVKIFAFGY